MTPREIGGAFAHMYQCAGMDAETLVALAEHLRACMGDPRDRDSLTVFATMSGLPLDAEHDR